MSEKKCKKCMIMIDDQASICPHCRSKQPSAARSIITIILLLIIVGTFGRACTDPFIGTPTESTAPKPEEPLTSKGKTVKAKHADWPNAICNIVAKKEIRIGMTTAQVKAAWGRPYKINTSQGRYGIHEQWVMYERGSDYVYFENGIMTSVQQSK